MPIPNPVRIAVGSPEGPRSATWRVWFGPNDVYAGFRTLGAVRKASIHYPRKGQPNVLRYVGYTKNFAEKQARTRVARSQRTHIEWLGAGLQEGSVVEFRFRVPHSELRVQSAREGGAIAWIPAPGPGRSVEVTIVSSPGHGLEACPQRSDGEEVKCLAQAELANGLTVWVLCSSMRGPSDSELRQHRFEARQTLAVNGVLPQAKAACEGARFNLTFECPDGSAGELELAADFLLNADA